MKRFVFIAVLIFSQCVMVFAQTVTVKGRADKCYWNNLIKAYVYDDYISERQKEAGSSAVDDKGNFSLNFQASATIFVMLRVENKQATLYCEPGKTYEVALLPPDSGAVETIGSTLPVDLTFAISDSMELNYLIYKYNYFYDAFLAKKIGWNMKDALELNRRIDTFSVRIRRRFAYARNDYFQYMLTYTCASLKTTFKKPEILYNEYIKDKLIVYTHQEQMIFINTFLAGYLSSAVESAELKKQVNETENLPGIEKYFSGLKFMENDTLRELAIAKALALCFNNSVYKKDHLSGLLKAAVASFKVRENKKIAENLNYKLGRFLTGETAPPFELPDQNGKKIKLENFRGKYIYLAFYRSGCKVCEEELRLIPAYKKKYEKKIEFIYISIDKSMEDMKKILKNYPAADWIFLFGGREDKIKEDYGIVTIPMYFLISPQGTFLQAPAQGPGLDVEKIFDGINKKK